MAPFSISLTPTPTPGLLGRELLVIDQVPLFEEAMSELARVLRSIEEIKQELRNHEAVHLPGYERWYHGAFGKLLTEIREAQGAFRDRATVLAALKKRHWEKFFDTFHESHAGDGGHLGRDAEADLDDLAEAESSGRGGFRVFETRNGRDADERLDRSEEESGEYGPAFEESRSSGQEQEFYDEEQDYADEESGAAWFEELFARDRSSYRGRYRARTNGGDERESGGSSGSGESRRRKPGNEAALSGDSEDPASRLAARLKDRYRLLAKQLHPDLNPQLTIEQKDLWLRAQRAYEAGNLEELDLLLALSGAILGKVPETASLRHLRDVAQEIERVAAALRTRLEEVKHSRPWRLTQPQTREALKQSVEKELRSELSALRSRMRELDAQILRFTPKQRAAGRVSGVTSRDAQA